MHNLTDDTDLNTIGAELYEHRALPDDTELARMHRRALQPTPRRKAARGRAGLVSLLAAGMLMSGTGATMAIDGIASQQDASVAQYGAPDHDAAPASATQNEATNGSSAPTTLATRSASKPTAPAAPVAASDQLARSGQELPFTGYAGFTILLIGFALLGAGLVLRRRSAPDRL